jgi:predicted GIY-YIG superfamily endonuclease
MVYLIPFSQKLHHAQHYIGFVATDLIQRVELHRAGRGGKLLAALNQKEIEWKVVRVWMGGDRSFERWLKNNTLTCNVLFKPNLFVKAAATNLPKALVHIKAILSNTTHIISRHYFFKINSIPVKHCLSHNIEKNNYPKSYQRAFGRHE